MPVCRFRLMMVVVSTTVSSSWSWSEDFSLVYITDSHAMDNGVLCSSNASIPAYLGKRTRGCVQNIVSQT